MIDEILNIIKDNVEVYNDSSNDLKIRCPYCGDSKKNPRATKLYISKTPVPKYGTYMYHCFRAECGAKGPLLDLISFLGLFGDLKKEHIIFLLEQTPNYKKKNFTSNIDIDLDEYETKSNNSVTIYKLNYIKDRLGLNDIPEFIYKTLVTTFRYLPIQNNINQKLMDYLENSFVGFRTFDKCKIICRNTDKTSDFRYYNIKLKDKTDYYITSPVLNNINTLKKGTILIAEGIFSVLRGYLYLKDFGFIKEKNNIVLGASLGGKPSSFKLCYDFINYSLGVPDWDLWILSDSEIPKEHYYILKKYCFSSLKILYNTLAEDFGSDKCEVTFTYI